MHFWIRISALVSLTFVAACSSGQRNDDGSKLPYAGSEPTVRQLTDQYGVGLGTFAYLESYESYGWCNGVVGNPSQCTGDVPGVRKYSYTLRKKQILSDGEQSFDISAVSKIGTGNYLMAGEVAVTMKAKSPGAGAQIVNSGWDDTLYIKSKTLKNGTPVTIGVQLALLNASRNIACDAENNSNGQLELYVPNVKPPQSDGSQFEITGSCVGEAWEYYLYGNTKNMGTTGIGTISTKVGGSFILAFSLSGDAAVSCNNYCSGDIKASLSGKYKFTITSITQGATYKSASGDKYQ